VRICYFAEAGSVHSQKWVRYFAESGQEVHWLSLSPFKQMCPDACCYALRPGGSHPIGVVASAPAARRLVRKIDPEVVHVHYLGAYALLALLAGRRPLVATAWGSDVLISARSPLKRAVVKAILGRADLVTCDAEHMASAVRALCPGVRRLEIVNFGVDTAYFTPGPADCSLEKQLEVAGCPVVISLRNLEPVYDVGSLIRAAPSVLKQRPATRFLIVGSGSQGGELRQLARRLGVERQVRFVGPVPNAQLPRYLRLADVYVSTALSDAGIAASTAEAMACGLPVVATASGENHRWIQPGRGGLLTPLRDPDALATGILWLLNNVEAGRAFGQVNREVIETRNNYQVEMAKMLALYEELAQG